MIATELVLDASVSLAWFLKETPNALPMQPQSALPPPKGPFCTFLIMA